MNKDDLLLRQQRLLMRSAQLRLTLGQQTQFLKGPLIAADQARAGLQWLYRNPLWPLGTLLVLVILRPRRSLAWGGRLWWGWKTYQRARDWVATLPIQGMSR